ncbi:MAG: hypothetical protein CM1200mP10_20870 [Candidatus Neomarinimicrobiota bacterium]|nr:MAG: hypothetical protein CM1200mP10_20870 [Candidatus Neomarinimicrobiota bacterium]
MPVNNEVQMTAGIKQAITYHQQLEARREDLPYEIDGSVIKNNSLLLRDEVGYAVEHHAGQLQVSSSHSRLPQ